MLAYANQRVCFLLAGALCSSSRPIRLPVSLFLNSLSSSSTLSPSRYIHSLILVSALISSGIPSLHQLSIRFFYIWIIHPSFELTLHQQQQQQHSDNKSYSKTGQGRHQPHAIHLNDKIKSHHANPNSLTSGCHQLDQGPSSTFTFLSRTLPNLGFISSFGRITDPVTRARQQ